MESEKRYKILVETMNDGIGMIDKEGVFTYVNPKLAKMLGYEAEEILGRHGNSFFDETNKAIVEEHMKKRKEGAHDERKMRYFNQNWVNALRDWREGRRRTRVQYDQPLFDETAGNVVGQGTIATETLWDGEERIRAIVESSQDWIWAMNLQGVHIYSNPAVEEILGYRADEIVGGQSLDLMHEEDRRRVEADLPQWIQNKKGWTNLLIRWRHKNGEYRHLESSAVPILDGRGEMLGFRGVDRDITERKLAEEAREKLEAQLRQAQKMEAIGTLAGGIAHDFNNILQAICSFTELATYEIPKDSPAGKRATELVAQILTFSRQREQTLQTLKVQTILKEALKLLRGSLPSTIKIDRDIDKNCKTILADPTQIHQVIMNLRTNAYHAMRDEGGLLEVVLKNSELTPERAGGYLDVEPGEFVSLVVRDTGCGMDEETMERIFEPFFTT